MPKTNYILDELTPEAKRLFNVFIDQGGNQASFAKDLGLTQSTISRILSGQRPLTENVIRPICQRWGYSAEWLLLGKGNKKVKVDSTKLVTEIQMLRTEIDVISAVVKRLEARMKGYEGK